MSHCSERELFDDSDQPAQARTHHAQYLQRDLGMSEAERVKVLLAYKEEGGIVDCGDRGRVIASIEDWKLCDRTARPINAEYLLAAASGTLEDADVTRLNHIQSRARLTLSENRFAC